MVLVGLEMHGALAREADRIGDRLILHIHVEGVQHQAKARNRKGGHVDDDNAAQRGGHRLALQACAFRGDGLKDAPDQRRDADDGQDGSGPDHVIHSCAPLRACALA